MGAVPASGPFFLRSNGASDAAPGGGRFCFFRAPPADVPLNGTILAVHAFAEEMNKSRAVAADGARAFAAAGFAVLQIDLTGCGDSAGDFGDARWNTWLGDVRAGLEWLQRHVPVGPGRRWLWGTRLGALLADQFAATSTPRVDNLLLWQPVVNGAQHLGQFLRLKTVGDLLRDGRPDATPSPASTPVARVAQPSPRADLASGHAIEVAGYRLDPTLADAIEAARLGAVEQVEGRMPGRVRWFEVSSQSAATQTPIAARIVERWRAAGADIAVTQVVGSAFWQTQEIERCDALVAASVAALDGAATAA